MKTVAIVLAAGKGKRMGQNIAKQFLLLNEKPVLSYTLDNFEKSAVDEIIIVTSEDSISFCENEIVKKYGYKKVTAIVAGGKERYHSVAKGLEAVGQCDYVLIHDGARPFVDADMIQNIIDSTVQYKACVMAMPVKDTIRIATEDGFAKETPNRNLVWQIQTPQAFEFLTIKDAYHKLVEEEEKLSAEGVVITDDAMVLEQYSDIKIRLVKGSYRNIKLTTPEDLEVAKTFINSGV